MTQENQKKTALLVVDVQQGLFQKSTRVYQAEALLDNINCLAEQARAVGALVVYIQHADQRSLAKGSAGWQLHAQLQVLPGDRSVCKEHGNAFEATSLAELLDANGIRRVVVTGLVTHGCVKATCLGARELGYEVVLAADAHSSFSKNAVELIAEWHAKLQEQAVEILPTAEIAFKE